ncbi:hypothetical protein [Bosea thiooxidans]
MTSTSTFIDSSPAVLASSSGKTITIERLQTGLLRVKVNGVVVATDSRGTVLNPLAAALKA